MSTEGMDTHLAQIGAFLKARGIGEDMSDRDIVTAVTYGLDRAHEIIASLQAEIAALRGDLPEGWERQGHRLPTWLRSDTAGLSAEINDVHPRGYHWEARNARWGWADDGWVPTLVEAIAACEAAWRRA